MRLGFKDSHLKKMYKYTMYRITYFCKLLFHRGEFNWADSIIKSLESEFKPMNEISQELTQGFEENDKV